MLLSRVFRGIAVEFGGRRRELARLRSELDEVRASGQGRMLAVRGRRQARKS